MGETLPPIRQIAMLTFLLIINGRSAAIADTSSADAVRLNNVGVTNLNKGDLKAAIANFTEALQKEPNYPLPLTNRILAKYRSGDYEGVVSDYEGIRTQPRLLDLTAELMPKDLVAKCYAKKGLSKSSTGDSRAAIECFNLALKLAPHEPEYYHYRGLAERESGDAPSAAKDFEEESLLRVPVKRQN